MRRPGGYGVTTFADRGRTEEEDTFTCCHCNCIVTVPPNQSAGTISWCGRCSKPICRKPECNSGCVPFEKKLEQMEARDRFLRSVGV